MTLVERLGSRLGVELPPDLPALLDRGGVDPADGRPPWVSRFERATRAIGLQVKWVRGTAAEVGPLATPQTPLVTFVGLFGGETVDPGQWIVVEGHRLGRFDGAVVPHFGRAQRWDAQGLARAAGLSGGAEPGLWAWVEVLWPSAQTADHPSPWRRAYDLLSTEREGLGAVAVYGVATGMFTLATPLAIQALVGTLAIGAMRQQLFVVSAALLVSLTLAAVVQALRKLAAEIVQRRLFVRVGREVAGRLARVSGEAFDDIAGPVLVHRFFDVANVMKQVSLLSVDGLGAALQAGLGLVLMGLYHPMLLAFDLALFGAIAIVLVLFSRGALASAIRESARKYEVVAWMHELARAPQVFRHGDGSALAFARAEGLTRGWLDARRAHWQILHRQYNAALVVQVVASVALLWLCGGLVLEGQLTLGQLVAAEFMLATSLSGLIKVTESLEKLWDLLAGVDKIGYLLDIPVFRTTGVVGADHGPIAIQIEVPLGDTTVRAEVPAGARLAAWGGDAAHRRSLADRLVGSGQTADGVVLLDEVPDKEWLPEALHRATALVRGVDVLATTVLENVAMGRPGVDGVAVMRQLSAVGLTAEVEAQDGGLDAVLSADGRPLSENAGRLLCFARAMAGRPRLLVVDGALDALPAERREPVLKALLDPEAPWTLVVFSGDPALAARFPQQLPLRDGGPRG